MKKIILIYFIISSALCFSQKQNTDVQVEYKIYCNTDVPLTFNSLLWISNNVSIYQEKLSTTERWEERPTEIENIDVRPSKDILEPYLKIDRNKKEVLFYSNILKNTFLIKDNYIDLKWNITNETKKIADYNCIKATANFRGREWVAWFTPEIPLPFGPWKLHGLPGLILEANDSTERFAYKVTKIENKKNNLLNQDFKTLIATKNKNPISYQQFMADQEEAMENLDREISQKFGGSVTTVKAPRNTEELIYEWE